MGNYVRSKYPEDNCPGGSYGVLLSTGSYPGEGGLTLNHLRCVCWNS